MAKKTFKKTFGSRAEVFHGNAKKTTGGLMKKDLMKNKHGEIVSKKKHLTAKKEKRLEKHGYFAKKGSFGYVKKAALKSKKSKTARKTSKTMKKKRRSKK
tara:strand:+ start:284 stop:583 length:300 start_codon:yes stop_codon:yes gene_type:complete